MCRAKKPKQHASYGMLSCGGAQTQAPVLQPGVIDQAYEQLEQAALFASEHGSHHVPLVYLIFIQKGEIHYEWNQLETAVHHLKKGLELGDELGPQNQTLARYLI